MSGEDIEIYVTGRAVSRDPARKPVVVQFVPDDKVDKREIPSAALRAGSSLRLKNGYVPDDPM
jgi:hypothetical protein